MQHLLLDMLVQPRNYDFLFAIDTSMVFSNDEGVTRTVHWNERSMTEMTFTGKSVLVTGLSKDGSGQSMLVVKVNQNEFVVMIEKDYGVDLMNDERYKLHVFTFSEEVETFIQTQLIPIHKKKAA